jgi:drug/metabolite transporter (DMT)-like permease
MSLKFLLPFSFALFAALGNVFFVLGNRKVGPASNPFFFTATAMAVCLALFLTGTFFFGMRGGPEFLRRNLLWCALSGVGMFMTFTGFYLLYSRFDTSYYALFVVTSMLLTTLVLGVLVLREHINLYGGISIAAAVVSIVFFGLSKR